MDRNHVLGMICGYYLSRFEDSYVRLGLGEIGETHQALGSKLNVPQRSIGNWRDEFDAVYGHRRGWRNREMFPSRVRVIEALEHLGESELRALIQSIAENPSGDVADRIVLAVAEYDEQRANKTFALRGPTGKGAEEGFVRYHALRKDPIEGELFDRRDEQCGFDFEIRGSEQTVYVEVKGLAGVTGGIAFTDKEWRTATQLGDAYYLVVVRQVFEEVPEVRVYRDPSRLFQATQRAYTVVQVGWSVGDALLRKVDRESTK